MPEIQFQAPFISGNTEKVRIDVEHIKRREESCYQTPT